MENDDKGQIIIYQTDNGKINIDVLLEDETVWLTQQQMSELFQTSRTNVVEHIKHIYEEGELEENSTCRKFRQVREEGNRTVSRMMPYYNLDMIRRVESLLHFLRWFRINCITQFTGIPRQSLFMNELMRISRLWDSNHSKGISL